MQKSIQIQTLWLCVAILASAAFCASAQSNVKKAAPVFVNGEVQVVPEFSDPDKWIVHDLWVETTFDTDGNGQPNRMHVDV